eukprot:4815496-Amphidinium_carterae.2
MGSSSIGVAGLRQAWREAEATNAAQLKSVSSGLPEENLDDPFCSAIAQVLRKRYKELHGFNPLAAWLGPASLLGRLHREFTKYAHVMMSFKKVRSQELSDVMGPPVHTLRFSNESEVCLPGDSSATNQLRMVDEAIWNRWAEHLRTQQTTLTSAIMHGFGTYCGWLVDPSAGRSCDGPTDKGFAVWSA